MSRIQTITMPKWGMTMTEGKIALWLKNEGERIAPGEEFVEVETEKITNVVEAETGGLLRRILVRPGQSAPCGAPIAILAEADVPDEELNALAATAAAAEAQAGGLTEAKVDAGGGMRLNVVTAGAGEGVPLVLLHGFGSDAASWMFVQEKLAAGRNVHAIDLPSHGASDVDPSVASLDALADKLAAAIEQIAPGDLHLGGHSLGGRLALRLAARLGGRVKSLTLVAPSGMGGPVNPDFVQGFLGAEKRRPMKEALKLLVADEDAITSDTVERALASKRIDGAQAALDAIAASCLGPSASDGVEAELAEVSAPVLVIWGAEDRVIAAPADGKATVIEKAGHMPQMEAAARVADLVSKHLEAAQ